MAEFITAFNITMQTEGGYNPGDGEAETYMGIDRSQNSGWSGWNVIDSVKAANPGASVSTLNTIFQANTDLQTDIQQFYKVNYWDTLQLDTVNDQQVANALFDCSVNPCIITASKAAQMACNTVIQKSVGVDGSVGPLTIGSINSLPPNLYLTAFNGIRVANYYERIRLTPANQQWLSSWLGRCKSYAEPNA
ncbi:glycosyl hydrolase family 108 [Mucilaginibacter frigoritolerans]|jgi:lysozyme family protein|uniref:Glycosyl hydrolase family 108 n=1 Tax=Mucilaginibacter frigoritolerans TaxID=652788 RepID=A0A562TYY1_9SPHI|nr:glycosyl hydrolase 108 family protein [Mucilaginibacter frigoritolerans]TWI98767.1 glycosyl hydrolase family 108 [Mucilaginibacter frigoritolerans]